jgi:hypothetical protein
MRTNESRPLSLVMSKSFSYLTFRNIILSIFTSLLNLEVIEKKNTYMKKYKQGYQPYK